jgi:hypothetical protein
MTATPSRNLVRNRILQILDGGKAIAMHDLAQRIYGHSGSPYIARTRQQISILRGDGHEVLYDRKMRAFQLTGSRRA